MTVPLHDVRLLRVAPGGDLAPDNAFAAALVTLWHCVALGAAGDDPGPSRAEVTHPAAAVVEGMRGARSIGYAAIRGRDLLAVGAVEIGTGASAHTARVTALYVDPPAARRGLGTRVLIALEEAAASRGVDRFTATVPDEPGVVSFFRARGYAAWGRLLGWERTGGGTRDRVVLGVLRALERPSGEWT